MLRSVELPPSLRGLGPRAQPLLDEALTHRTWVNEHPGLNDNQRLELLGDAVLGLVITEALHDLLPTADEGLLSRARAAIVYEAALAKAARAAGLGAILRLGRGEAQAGGRDRDRNLADTYEAVVGALYLGDGLDRARTFVRATLGTTLDEVVAGAAVGQQEGVDTRIKDPKSVLQELVQRDGSPPPAYEHEDPEGPPHERTFSVRVIAMGRELGRGRGRSRREAEKLAAVAAIESLAGAR